MFDTYHRVIFLAVLLVCSMGLMADGAADAGGNTIKKYTAANQTNQPSPKKEKEKIRKTWVTFFEGSTKMQTRLRLLQNGQRYTKALKNFSQSKMAQQASASITGIKLNNDSTATVSYIINVGGAPVLKDQTGKAVRVNGNWKVSDKAFCSLLKLSGKVPSACQGIIGGNS